MRIRSLNPVRRTSPLLILLGIAAGCASAARPELNYEGYSIVSDRNSTIVDAVVTVRNKESTTAKIPVAICPYQLIAFSDADRKLEPLWKSAPDTCISDLMLRPPILVAPGDSFDYRLRVTIPADITSQTVYLSMTVPGHRIPVGQVSRR
jgi:hypothetical protein